MIDIYTHTLLMNDDVNCLFEQLKFVVDLLILISLIVASNSFNTESVID